MDATLSTAIHCTILTWYKMKNKKPKRKMLFMFAIFDFKKQMKKKMDF